MNLEDIKTEEIKDYIQQEKGKGRTIKDIVKELVAVRSDVTLLSHDPIIAEQQIVESLKQYQK
jgi:hypothetical protein